MNFMFRLKNVGSAAFLASICALSLQVTAPTQAQWLPDRAYTEGPGIRVGDLELHPGVAVRGGYDTNVFRTQTDRTSSAILAVTPHLNLKTLGRQRLTQGEDGAGATQQTILPAVAFNLGAAGTFFKYFEKTAPTNAEIDADGAVSILPDRQFGLDIGASYVRSIRPFGAFAGLTANNVYALDTIRPVLNLRAQSRSGVLRGTLAYAPTLQIYENSLYNYLNSRQHEVSASAGWKFLPSTALVYDGAFTFMQYQNASQSNSALLLSPNSSRYQSRVGVNGAITNHIGTRLLVGYSAGLYSEKRLNDYENVIGEAAFNYRVDANVVEIGYQRTVQPSALGAWMEQDRGYLSLETLLARVVSLKLAGGIAHANYGRLLNENGGDLGFSKKTGATTDKRQDLRGDAGFHAEYRATNWLAFMADLSVLATKTDFTFNVAGRGPFAAQFLSLQAFGGVRAHY